MTAFEGGWSVLKMPIVPHSLQEFEPSGERGTRRNWRASFDDPVTGERLPVQISSEAFKFKDEDGEGVELQMEGGIGEKTRDAWGAMVNPAMLWAVQELERPQDWGVGNSFVEGDLQRRGMGTALYDLLASIIESEYGGRLYGQGDFQSDDALALWESNRGALYDAFSDSWKPSRNLWRDRRDAE